MAREEYCRSVAAIAASILGLAALHGGWCRGEAGQRRALCLGPSALAASSDGRSLYVACADARQVLRVELPEGRVAQHIDLPAPPSGLAFAADQATLIVACQAPRSTVVLLDLPAGPARGSIQVGHGATSPVVSADGERLYVCNRFDNDVSVIDLASGRQIARVAAVREPVAADVTPDGRLLLVANHLPNTRSDQDFAGEIAPAVTLIDTLSLETAEIPLRRGANSLRGLCVTPDGRHALVTHLLANFEMVPFRVDTGWIDVNVVSIIDIARRQVISTIGMDDYDLGAGNPWDVKCSGDGRWVCVSSAGTHQLCVIPRAELLGDFAHRTMQPMMAVWPIYLSLGESLWRRVPLAGKGPRGLAFAGSTVYAAEYFSDTLAAVDLDGPPRPAPAVQPAKSIDLADREGDAVRTIALGPSPRMSLERQGEMLFNDATICYEHWLSCASCHPDGRADGLNWDLMNDSQGNPKNTKSMLLSHATPPSMAEGVRATAEVAVRAGIRHILFAERPEAESVAIDAYLRSLEPVPSPYRVGGRLSPAAERGREQFNRLGCDRCHPVPLYTDLKMHDVGTRRTDDYTNRFDTPTLVEVWRTAPYLHDGRYATIRDLLIEGRHGLEGGRGSLATEREIDDLAEFVLSLP
ncbi:MAG: cell surface protein [Planctomycetota bacterium]|nr:cell surface protein [Planctomycetota bacterium]